MEDPQYIDDTTRRQYLNARRVSYDKKGRLLRELPGNATNNINPITGQKWDAASEFDRMTYEKEPTPAQMEKIKKRLTNFYPGGDKYNPGKIYYEWGHPIQSDLKLDRDDTPEFIKYQLALAAMAARNQGSVSASVAYRDQVQTIKTLLNRMISAGVPLEVISTPNGLHDSMGAIEWGILEEKIGGSIHLDRIDRIFVLPKKNIGEYMRSKEINPSLS